MQLVGIADENVESTPFDLTIDKLRAAQRPLILTLRVYDTSVPEAMAGASETHGAKGSKERNTEGEMSRLVYVALYWHR